MTAKEIIEAGLYNAAVELMDDEIREGWIGEVPQVEDVLDIDGLPYALFDDGFILRQDLCGAAADHAEAENGNIFHK